MDIKEKFYEIIERNEEGEDGNCDDCLEQIEEFMESIDYIREYKIEYDTDVFDSCGMDIYYIFISWITLEGNLDMCGCSYRIY